MSMEEVVDEIMDKISARVPRAENEYLGADGLFHCSVCHKATETEITHPFTGKKRKVRCVCDCKNELMKFNERQKQEELDRQRRICFSESNMAAWTFEVDDRKNPAISDAMMRYVENFAEFRKEGRGLLLYGNVGTGKTFYAACIANKLIDKNYKVYMTNFESLVNQLQGKFEGKQEFINSLNKYSLLIIDDLGAERKSEFMQGQVYNIIDARYRSGLPFIITTNLTAEELKKPQDIGYSRIYDRILERCFPVKVDGVSRRRQNVKDTYFDVKEKLGL